MSMEAKAKSQPTAEISLRIKRKGSDSWEDGPVIHSAVKMPLKVRVLVALHNALARLQSKLEERKTS